MTPTLIHPEGRVSEDCGEEEVSDSEELVILFGTLSDGEFWLFSAGD
jgi:hypothetical protein